MYDSNDCASRDDHVKWLPTAAIDWMSLATVARHQHVTLVRSLIDQWRPFATSIRSVRQVTARRRCRSSGSGGGACPMVPRDAAPHLANWLPMGVVVEGGPSDMAHGSRRKMTCAWSSRLGSQWGRWEMTGTEWLRCVRSATAAASNMWYGDLSASSFHASPIGGAMNRWRYQPEKNYGESIACWRDAVPQDWRWSIYTWRGHCTSSIFQAKLQLQTQKSFVDV